MTSNDPLAAIERRFGFRLPELYRTLCAGGHFDPRNDAAWLNLTDFEWLTPEAIAEYKVPLDWQAPYKTWFVPFAISGRHDEWGWRLDWAAGGEPHLPKPWAARLKTLAKTPWRTEEGGTICVFPRSECDEIVATDLAFAHLNEKFWLEEPPKRKEPEKAPRGSWYG